jgi:hypothetical protein
MRLIGFVLIAALVAAAQPAAAASAPVDAPDRVGPPPAQPRAQADPAPIPKPLPAPRPAQSFASGGISGGLIGFQPLRPFGPGLVGLPPAGDQAPQCRAACAKIHNQCAGQGEETCDSNWTQCVAGCRGAR